jgi:hypothetical protein
MLELSLVVGLLVIAAALRFAQLDQLPPRLYHDEAYEGLDALKILGGQTPIYLTANFGVPKLVGAPIDITGRIERQCDR